MGKKTLKMNQALQLMQARQEALDQRLQSTMKSHGKVFDAETFTWHNPPVDVLAKTLENFPFPLVWVCNADLLLALNEHLQTKAIEFKAIICVGAAPEGEVNEDLFELQYVSDVHVGLHSARKLLDKNCVFLLTGDAPEESANRLLLQKIKGE
jgi:hypothetical protein